MTPHETAAALRAGTPLVDIREADEFREVFYSVLDAEKPRWIRSLQVRGIAVPNQLKDEIVMLVNDLREAKMHA